MPHDELLYVHRAIVLFDGEQLTRRQSTHHHLFPAVSCDMFALVSIYFNEFNSFQPVSRNFFLLQTDIFLLILVNGVILVQIWDLWSVNVNTVERRHKKALCLEECFESIHTCCASLSLSASMPFVKSCLCAGEVFQS